MTQQEIIEAIKALTNVVEANKRVVIDNLVNPRGPDGLTSDPYSIEWGGDTATIGAANEKIRELIALINKKPYTS